MHSNLLCSLPECVDSPPNQHMNADELRECERPPAVKGEGRVCCVCVSPGTQETQETQHGGMQAGCQTCASACSACSAPLGSFQAPCPACGDECFLGAQQGVWQREPEPAGQLTGQLNLGRLTIMQADVPRAETSR